ncbi:MAG: hypothetical protein Q4C11_01795 [Clostridium sp.]|nr:hypothetical protein [Clostridium sp.]
MKITNRRKFIVRILDLIVILCTSILTPAAINYATLERGHQAFGGEYLIPIIGLLLIMVAETLLEESK